MAELSFIASKLFWLFAAPANFLCLLLLLGAFFALSRRQYLQSAGKKICFGTAMALFLLAVLPFGQWLLTPLENVYPVNIPDRVDGIILLGGDEDDQLTIARGEPMATASAPRYLKFIELARHHPAARLAFTGGTSKINDPASLSQADIARQIFQRTGAIDRPILYEDKSRNTVENAIFAKQLVKPGPEENWLVVTTAYHMPRAIGCFRAAGWNVWPAPAGYLTRGGYAFSVDFNLIAHMVEVHLALREYYGLIAYALMGRIAWPW